MTTLYDAVSNLAQSSHALSDAALNASQPWLNDRELRYALLWTYEDLRRLAAVLASERAAAGPPITTVQRLLAQHHAGYRDLQAVLIGLEEPLIDQPPAAGEWTIREVLWHAARGERSFLARTWHAVEQGRAGLLPTAMSNEEVAARIGADAESDQQISTGPWPKLLQYYDREHERVLAELSGLTDRDLGAPAIWYDKLNRPLVQRLTRFDGHLRQHVIQIEKALEALGQRTNEARRLLRLIYAALAEVEGVCIGAPALGAVARRELGGVIEERASHIQ